MSTLLGLFNSVVNGETASSLIKECKNETEIGHYGEAIVRMAVALHIDPKGTDKNVEGLVYIPGKQRFDYVEGESYLSSSNVVNSCKTGSIDAAWMTGDVYNLCSSKFGKKSVSSLKDLDISDITQDIYKENIIHDGNIVQMNNVVYYVIVRNKQDVCNILNKNRFNAIRGDLKSENVLDIDDLDRICFKIQNIMSYKRDIRVFFEPKRLISLRFHQALICRGGTQSFQNGSSKILIGALPRSGKTYIGAKLCVGYSKILVLTTRPSETRASWNSVFSKALEFDGYKIRNMDAEIEDEAVEDMSITIASTQFYKYGDRRSKKCVDWDMILIDEIHEGGCTDKSEEIMKSKSDEHTKFVLMTATYAKPIEKFGLDKNDCFFWDLEDIRIMKTRSIKTIGNRMYEKYGANALSTLHAFTTTKHDVSTDYLQFPDLYLLTTSMTQKYYSKLMSLMEKKDNIYGFSMKTLFDTTKDDSAFQNPKAVDKFLELISGSNVEEDYPDGDLSMLARIERIQMMNGHDRKGFLTMQWFLPYGVGQKLDGVKNSLIRHIKQNPILKDFEVMTFESGNTSLPQDVANKIVLAKKNRKIGLIILTGDVGSLGVSIPEIDATFLLHDFESSDKTFQQLTRCLTEDYFNGKRVGVVVDFNVWRVLNTVSAYAIGRCGKTFNDTREKITWIVSNLMRIDSDLWECPEMQTPASKASVIEELTAQWTRMMETAGYSLKRLEGQIADIGSDQSMLNSTFNHSSTASSNTTEKNEKFEDGRSVRSEGSDTESDDESVKTDIETKVKNININELIARLIPEMAILTNGNLSLVDAFKYIGDKPELRCAMNTFLKEFAKA